MSTVARYNPSWLAAKGFAVAVFLAGSLAGCLEFDRSGVDPGGGLPGDPSCPQPIVTVLSINGTVLEGKAGEPVPSMLVGDTVTLSAAGSCVKDGPMALEWRIVPDLNIEATAMPGLDALELTVVPSEAGMYQVELTIEDGKDNLVQLSVPGLAVLGWTSLDRFPGDKSETVRDMAIDSDTIYLSADPGLFTARLSSAAAATFQLLGVSGDPLDNPQPTFYDQAHDHLWVGSKSGTVHEAWRVNLASMTLPSVSVPFPSGRAVDFAVDLDTVFIATDQAVYKTENLATPTLISTIDSTAIAVADGDTWVGSNNDLTRVRDNMSVDLFPNTNDAISTLLADGDTLWIGSQSQGLVRYGTRTGAKTVYTKDTGLGSNQVRAVAIETAGPYAGDVWVATAEGIMRFKADRKEWVAIDPDGTNNRTNTLSIAVDTNGGRRVIYGGSTNGLIMLGAP